MNPTQQAVIDSLRKAGYAVVLFTPSELGKARPKQVEARLIELANDGVIEDCIPEPSVTAYNKKTGVTIYFDPNTAPEWAAAYGYCEDSRRRFPSFSNLQSALFAAAQDYTLADFYPKLPLVYHPDGRVSCGDWTSGTEET